MSSTIESDEIEEVTGGKIRRRKNITAKKRKNKGNKVLAAWRDHVKAVAAAEGMSYGKEAMQMAKKGKHGKEWAQIKASLNSQKGGVNTPLEEDEKVEEGEVGANMDKDGANMDEDGANMDEDGANMDKKGANMDEKGANMDEDGANMVKDGEKKIPTVDAQENPDFVGMGGRRRSTKRKGRKSRKSRKQRKSRKH
jgi:hypothetical protein